MHNIGKCIYYQLFIGICEIIAKKRANNAKGSLLILHSHRWIHYIHYPIAMG